MVHVHPMASSSDQLPKHFLCTLQENRYREEITTSTIATPLTSHTSTRDPKDTSKELIHHHDERPIEDQLAGLHLSRDHEQQSSDEVKGTGVVNDSLVPDRHNGSLPSVFDHYCGNNHHDNEFDYVLEVYGFHPSLITKDLLKELHTFGSTNVRVKWVDDTHALAIYASSQDARIASKGVYSLIKVKPLANSTHSESKLMAQKVAKSMKDSISNESHDLSIKSHNRPKTTSTVARRMVGHALGVKIPVTPEQKMQEKLKIEKAKEDKKNRQR